MPPSPARRGRGGVGFLRRLGRRGAGGGIVLFLIQELASKLVEKPIGESQIARAVEAGGTPLDSLLSKTVRNSSRLIGLGSQRAGQLIDDLIEPDDAELLEALSDVPAAVLKSYGDLLVRFADREQVFVDEVNKRIEANRKKKAR